MKMSSHQHHLIKPSFKGIDELDLSGASAHHMYSYRIVFTFWLFTIHRKLHLEMFGLATLISLFLLLRVILLIIVGVDLAQYVAHVCSMMEGRSEFFI